MLENRRQQIYSLLGESVLLQEIFDSIQDGIMVVGEDRVIAYTNRTAEKLLGIPHEALVGVKAEELPLSMHYRDGEKIPRQSRPFASALDRDSHRGATQVILKRLDGSTLPVLFNIHRKEDGLTVVILTDNSDFMRQQNQQDVYYRLLAHDLRTPLTIILGHSELLKSELSQANEISVNAIHEAGKQLESMTEEMNDRMVLESGHFKLKKEQTRLESIISDVIGQFSSHGAKNHLDVRIEPLPVIKADVFRLKRVLKNLISNALKYAPENTIISISAWENGKGIMAKVSDQGQGIASEDLNYIFDPFYITSIGEEKGGTGLGLYIARLIMEAHDGRIYVSSSDEGTSFVLFLPKT